MLQLFAANPRRSWWELQEHSLMKWDQLPACVQLQRAIKQLRARINTSEFECRFFARGARAADTLTERGHVKAAAPQLRLQRLNDGFCLNGLSLNVRIATIMQGSHVERCLRACCHQAEKAVAQWQRRLDDLVNQIVRERALARHG